MMLTLRPPPGANDPTLDASSGRPSSTAGSRVGSTSQRGPARIEEDTDGDGKLDKWESYKDGSLVTLSLDTQGARYARQTPGTPRTDPWSV